MRILIALLSGSLFGLGLMVSDMIDPSRVLGFLRPFSGAWDPVLAFVMGGALIPMAVAWAVRRRRAAPVLGGAFPQFGPDRPDARLVAGAGLFGAGWGLAGFCPGPALAALVPGGPQVLVFVAAMVLGMLVHDRVVGPMLAARSA